MQIIEKNTIYFLSIILQIIIRMINCVLESQLMLIFSNFSFTSFVELIHYSLSYRERGFET